MLDHLGPPQISVPGLQIWLHGRQFPDHQDFWDGNWLRLTAHCGSQGTDVSVSGPLLHLSEIVQWRDGLRKINEILLGEAQLGGNWEPNILVRLKIVERMDHIDMKVFISPDHLTQKHSFHFGLDQTYLPRLLAQCEAMLDQYPVRNPPQTV